MGTNQLTTRGRELITERPGTIVVGIVAGYLLVDFIAKLVGYQFTMGATQVVGGNLSLSRMFTLVWDGLVIGLAIGLAGIGLSMTYSILKFANFAHGDYVTAGGFMGWAVTFLIVGLMSGQGDPGYLLSVGAGQGPSSSQLGINVLNTTLAIFAGLVVAIAGTIAVALLFDRYVYRPMRDEGAITPLIASIGIALVIRYVIVYIFGGSNRGLTAGGGTLQVLGDQGRIVVEWITKAPGSPNETAFSVAIPFLKFGTYTQGIFNADSSEITLVLIAIGLMAGLHLLLQRTKLGKSMRAMADNKDLAQVTGIPTERVIKATWIIGAGMAGASGYLIALERGTLSFQMGWILLLLIFAAVILGGIGSIYGAMAGGVIIGLTTTVSLIWIPSDLATVSAFLIMILMLLFRPSGLFGGVTTA